LKNLGSDLGGAVKGFKDGVKEGSATDAPASNAQAQDPKTIDIKAKEKV
jgi:sec-independent protein translocase protein TatA